RRFMGSRWLLVLLFSLTTSALLAHSPPPASTEPTVQSLLDRIQQLENRINLLEDRERKQEAGQAAAPTSTPAAPAETTTQAAIATPAPPNPPPTYGHMEDHTSMGEIRDTERRFPSLQIRGFGDVDFSATDRKGSVSGFKMGQLVLHLASPLSEKVSYFGEVSFTAQPGTYDL